MSASHFYSRLDQRLPSFRKGRVNDAGMWAKAVMSAPFPDLAGDVVVPSGMDFTPHHATREVDLEHRRDPGVRGMPVAWLDKSLGKCSEPYAVEMHRLNFGGDGEPDNWLTVPVCTMYFDKSCPVSSQVYAMVEQDALPGVSIEFAPVQGYMQSLGRSPLEPRDCYRFDRSKIHGLAICEKGVCPHALTLQKSAAATQVPHALAKILTDKRVNVGGTWTPLHAMILKALTPAEAPAKRTSVRVEMKAMDDELQTQNEAALDTAPPEEPQEGAGDAPPTAQAFYNFSQRVKEACEELKAATGNSEHKNGKKKAVKFCEMADALSEKAMGAGDMVTADVSDDAAEWDDEGEPEVEEGATEPDEEGVMKGMKSPKRLRFRKAIVVKRFKVSDIPPATPETVQKSPDEVESSPELKAAFADFQKWKQYAGK